MTRNKNKLEMKQEASNTYKKKHKKQKQKEYRKKKSEEAKQLKVDVQSSQQQQNADSIESWDPPAKTAGEQTKETTSTTSPAPSTSTTTHFVNSALGFEEDQENDSDINFVKEIPDTSLSTDKRSAETTALSLLSLNSCPSQSASSSSIEVTPTEATTVTSNSTVSSSTDVTAAASSSSLSSHPGNRKRKCPEPHSEYMESHPDTSEYLTKNGFPYLHCRDKVLVSLRQVSWTNTSLTR